MKDCKKIHPLLSLFLDGALSPKDAQKVEAHLEKCADARKELEQHKSLRRTLLSLPDPTVPHDLHDRIMSRLTVGAHPLPKVRHLFPYPALGLAAAACVAVFLLMENPELTRLSREKLKGPIPAPEKNPPRPFSHEESLKASGSGKSWSAPDLAVRKPSILDKDRTQGAAKKSGGMGPRMAAPPSRAPMGSEGAAGAASNAPAPAAQLALEEAQAPPTPVPTQGLFSNVLYSREVTASTWSGDNGPATVGTTELITDAGTFGARWQALRPGETVPAVDFFSQAVVFLQAGDESSGGYRLAVSNVEEKEDQVVLHYRLSGPVEGASLSPTRPWTLQVIPKPDKPVVFRKD